MLSSDPVESGLSDKPENAAATEGAEGAEPEWCGYDNWWPDPYHEEPAAAGPFRATAEEEAYWENQNAEDCQAAMEAGYICKEEASEELPDKSLPHVASAEWTSWSEDSWDKSWQHGASEKWNSRKEEESPETVWCQAATGSWQVNPPPAPVVQSECEKKIMPPKMNPSGWFHKMVPLLGALMSGNMEHAMELCQNYYLHSKDMTEQVDKHLENLLSHGKDNKYDGKASIYPGGNKH